MASPLAYEIFAPGDVVLEQGFTPPDPTGSVEDVLAQLLVDYAETRSMNLAELDGLIIQAWEASTVGSRQQPWEIQGSEWRR